MAQFSSSLYPQTNPSNPVLLEFRDNIREDATRGIPMSESIEDALIMCTASFWGHAEATGHQLIHARRVLTRLAALSG